MCFSFGRLARFWLAEWPNSGQRQKRLIWLETWIETLWSNSGVGQPESSTLIPPCFHYVVLLAVKFNDQLFIDRQLNIFALGQGQYSRLVSVPVNFEPVGQRAVAGKFFGHFQHGELLAVLANGNFLARTHLIRRNVDLAIVDRDVSVGHQLPRLPPRLRKAQAIHHIVQTPLQLLQEQFAGHTPGARSLLEVVAELAFQRE